MKNSDKNKKILLKVSSVMLPVATTAVVVSCGANQEFDEETSSKEPIKPTKPIKPTSPSTPVKPPVATNPGTQPVKPKPPAETTPTPSKPIVTTPKPNNPNNGDTSNKPGTSTNPATSPKPPVTTNPGENNTIPNTKPTTPSTSEVNKPSIDNTSPSKPIVTTPKPVELVEADVRVQSINIESWTGNRAVLKVVFIDEQNVLTDSLPVRISYNEEDSTINKTYENGEIRVRGKEKYAIFNIDFEKANIAYEINQVELKVKPANSKTNVGYDKANNVVFDKTREDKLEFKFVRFLNLLKINGFNNVSSEDDSRELKLKLNVNFEKRNIDLSNKFLRATILNEKNQRIFSNVVDGNTLRENDNVVFVFDTLSEDKVYKILPNREVVLDKIQISDVRNDWYEKPEVLFAGEIDNKKIETTPGIAWVTYFEVEMKSNTNYVKINTGIESEDRALEDGKTKVEFTFKSSKTNKEVKHIETIRATKNGQRANSISFKLYNLEPNETYELIKVRLLDKPTVTYKNINSSSDENNSNVVYEKDSKSFYWLKATDIKTLEFTTDSRFTSSKNDVEISSTKPLESAGEMGLNGSTNEGSSPNDKTNNVLISEKEEFKLSSELAEIQNSVKIKSFENVSSRDDSRELKLKLKVKLEKGNNNLSNKFLRASILNDKDQKVFSKVVNGNTLDQEGNIQFIFDTLSEGQVYKILPNREIHLDNVQVSDEEQEWYGKPEISFVDESDKKINTHSGYTWISFFNVETNPNNLQEVTINTGIESEDRALEDEKTQAKFTFKSNTGEVISYSAKIRATEDGQRANGISFKLSNLDPNKRYELIKVELLKKPSMTINNINSDVEKNNSNVVYEKDSNSFYWLKATDIERLDFKTSNSVPRINNNSKIEIIDNSSYEQNGKELSKMRGADHLDAAYAYQAKLSGVTIDDFDSVTTKIKISLVGKATISIPPLSKNGIFTEGWKDVEKTHFVEVKNVKYDKTNKVVTFNIEDLKAGYYYNLSKITIEKLEKENNAFKMKKYTYTSGGRSNTINWKPENPEMNEIEGIGYAFKSLKRSIYIDASHVPNPSNSASWVIKDNDSQYHLVIAFQNGWEVGDFGKLFNYLRMEVPKFKENGTKYAYNDNKADKVDLKNAWISKIKEEIYPMLNKLAKPKVGTFTYKELNSHKGIVNVTYPSIDRIKSIQLGTKWGKDDPERLLHVPYYLTNQNLVLNPILGGFEHDAYSSKEHAKDPYVNGPFSDEIINNSKESIYKTWNYFKLSNVKDVIDKTIEYNLNRDRNHTFKESK